MKRRVLDLTDHRGWMCGKIFADTDWEVIKVEHPGGDPGRKYGPYYHGDMQSSLAWFAYNTNKKGLTLDIETADGHELFKRLVRSSEIVLESFRPGYMDSIGLGYHELSKVNPRIILTSITPFGQTGPYRDYEDAHIVLIGLSGLMYMLGDPDRAPVQPNFPLAYVQASGQAAAATMIAFIDREREGKGQHVDVSMQSSGAMWPMNAIPAWHLLRERLSRAGQRREGRVLGGVSARYLWPCKDGFVAFTVSGGPIYVESLQMMVHWMDEEGMADDFLVTLDWSKLDTVRLSRGELQALEEPIGRFLLTRGKEQLAQEAAERGILLLPVASIEDIAQSRQLKDRGFWTDLRHEDIMTSLTYPGFFAKTLHQPAAVRHRAPHIGEHNLEIYREELGLSEEQINGLRQAGII